MIARRLLPAVAVLLWASHASGGKVEDAARMLQDSSFKVRVQAAAVLGKLGDHGAVEPLSRALHDSNKAVRAVAAQSLGRLGSRDAIPALEALLKREQDTFVRIQGERALVALGPRPAPGRGGGGVPKEKIFLSLGPFGGGTRSADAGAIEVLRAALKRELGKLSGVTFTLTAGEERDFARAGRFGFLIDGNVTRLEDVSTGAGVETNCDVKVLVARWPSKSIILWTSAGAAVQTGTRPQDRIGSRRDCLEASASQLGEDLSRFLQAQGG